MRRLIAWLTFLPVLAVGLWVFWFTSGMMRADFASMYARYLTEQWIAGKPWTVPEWNTARDDLSAAVRITPHNPMLYDYLGALFAFRGDLARLSPETQRYYYEQALPYQESSLQLRENNAGAWSAYAYSLFVMGDRGPALDHAVRRAMALGPYELDVRPRLQAVILGSWKTQPQDLRGWVVADYCAESASGQQKLAQLAAGMGNPVLNSAACAQFASK